MISVCHHSQRKQLQTFDQKPSNEEVEKIITSFFALLQAGEIEKAHGLVEHAYNDWEESIHLVWEDHHLIHESVDDSSFEGRAWINDRAWLKDLTIKDSMEWINEDYVWADLIYRGKASGYIAEFSVQKGDDGYFVQRMIFKMA
ncbi:MAG: hypothetical protein RLZZ618_915 [Pseudomonadota bacterium]